MGKDSDHLLTASETVSVEATGHILRGEEPAF